MIKSIQADVTSRVPKYNAVDRVLIPFIVAISFMMEQLDTTIVITALPKMADNFHTTAVSLNIAVTSYLLSLAVFMPMSGWAAERWGKREVYMAALLVFTVGSILCACSNGPLSLSLMRMVQGFGGALMTPVGRLILLSSFERSELVKTMTYMSVPVVIGPLMGPVLGGFLVQYTNWRWIFLVNVPIGVGGILLTLWRVRPEMRRMPAPFDWIGFIICAAGMLLLQIGTELLGRRSSMAWGGMLLAGGLAVTFLYSRRSIGARFPALDMGLMSIRTFRIGVLAGSLSRMGFSSIPFLLALLLQLQFGFTPFRTGLLVFAASFGAVIVRPLSSWLLRLLGFRTVLAFNSLVGAMTILPFTLMDGIGAQWKFVLAVIIFGISRALQFTNLNTISFVDIPADRLSRSTGLSGMAQQLSTGLGVALSAAMLNLMARGAHPDMSDFRTALYGSASLVLLGMAGFLQLRQEDGAHTSGWRPRGRVLSRTVEGKK
ncbi:MFS transporter [Komagataeibacter rhaeticus]|uniref:MFS transporter n=1 Tax=Komagataeibacter rhaeticus TaxID=215221 RepID=UPI001A3835C3|nr:MFS transporter [Komagataeibacter rhaeticus]MBL7239178.1 MFS transporter [Komagataeibacter rhaeticus]